MSDITFDVKGLKALDIELDKLDRKSRGKIVNKAIRAGAKIILEEAKERAPEDEGTLKKSLGIAAKKTKGSDKQVLILARKGKNQKYDAFYSHMVEFGTSHSAAKPFLGPAARDKAEEAIKKVGDVLQEELIKK